MENVLRGYSRAMYANWLWHRPLQLMVDAGEGLQLALGSHVFSPSHVVVTHGHSDHVLGLPGLIAARRFGKGATDKPLTVIYPDGCRGVLAVREWLSNAYAGIEFAVHWQPIDVGATIPLGKSRVLTAFPVRHTRETAFGYRVLELRRRLSPAFAGLPQAEIEAMARAGRRDEMLEEVSHVLFAHSGDAMPIDPAMVAGADLLVHDATFLHAPDRREPIHATTEEALEVARTAGVRTLVLYHLSIRYDRATALPVLRGQVAASGFRGDCWVLDEDRLLRLSTPVADVPT